MAYRHNVAGSGVGEILKWGLIGLAGYWIYQNFFATPAAATTTTPATTTTTAASTFNTLDAIYSRIVAAATADKAASTLTADGWNVYLAANSNVTPPDPTAVFPNQDRSTLMSSATYWSTMSAYLAKNMGMSGLGLYGGLGAFVRRRVR